jgi:two-component system chemotaxis response regulator CheY
MTPIAPAPRPVAGRTVLVVDDSGPVRRQLVQMLERAGAVASEAVDGADAWRRLQAGPVDALLTDLHMPVLDGLKLIALVRAAPAHHGTPIVVITALGTEADRGRALALGAAAYLEKPVESAELLFVLAELMRPRTK